MRNIINTDMGFFVWYHKPEDNVKAMTMSPLLHWIIELLLENENMHKPLKFQFSHSKPCTECAQQCLGTAKYNRCLTLQLLKGVLCLLPLYVALIT